MLGAEGDEVAHGRVVAPFDVAAQELPSLAEAEGVDGGRGRENRMRGDVGAGFGHLFGHVAEEGGGAVAGPVIVHADEVDERAGVDGVGEVADFAEAGGGVAVS